MAQAPRGLLHGACRAAGNGALHWSRLQEATTCWHDDSGRVLFPGDAGHPMVPTLGQGATTAIEDGAVFAVARTPERGLHIRGQQLAVAPEQGTVRPDVQE